MSTASPLASLIPGRLRCTDASCRTAVERAQEWIRTCEANHSCGQSETRLPTRLIDVGEASPSKSVKLVETVKGQTGQYIALSHCWGLSHRIKTTKTTIEDHKRSIRLSILPKTFQDAISCTRKFGIRWMWIDTLCIIQDDEEDWIAEAATMGDVYSNAYLTISAAASTDDSSGIFPSMDERLHEIPFMAADAHCHGRPGPLNVVPELNFIESRQTEGFALSPETGFIAYEAAGGVALVFLSPEWMPSSTRASMVKYQIGEFGMHYDPLDGEHLSKRGWTLQERLLSRRVLHYASDQMYFECLEGITAEDGASFPAWSRRMPQLKDLPINDLSRVLATSLSIGNSKGISPSEGSNRKEWSRAWMKLVEDYSPRLLTRADDKLPAVGGLANAISRLTGAQYLAGHWDIMLLETLAWQVKSVEHIYGAGGRKNEHPSKIPWKSLVSSPESYRAPSWSWASVDAEVNFSFVKKVTASVIDWHVETAPGDRFGRVTSSWLKLRGALLSIRERESNQTEDRSKYPYSQEVSMHGCRGIEIDVGTAYFDKDPDFVDLHALVLSSKVGILLRQKGCNDQYVRVGLVTLNGLLEGPNTGGTGSGHIKNLLDAGGPIEELETATASYLPWAEVTII